MANGCGRTKLMMPKVNWLRLSLGHQGAATGSFLMRTDELPEFPVSIRVAGHVMLLIACRVFLPA